MPGRTATYSDPMRVGLSTVTTVSCRNRECILLEDRQPHANGIPDELHGLLTFPMSALKSFTGEPGARL